MPPGGPEDFDTPKVLRVRPDTNAVNVREGGITFEFDEVVSERPQGATDLASLFVISPSHGENSVSWKRTQVTVRPRDGFTPNTTYSITMLPGLVDLEGNADSTGRSVVFSTGPTIATGHMRGIVFDWLADKSAPRALIEAFPIPTARDSTRYIALADSVGRFDLGHLPPGQYLLRTIVDQNKNRLLDPRELYDSATVTLTDSLRREMLAFVRDTLGPGIQNVAVVDSLTLRVTLDHALDTAMVITPAQFSVKESDSTVAIIARALTQRQFDAIRADSARAKAVQDSLRAVARADSARRADSTRTDSAGAGQVRRTPPPPPRPAVDTTALAGTRDTVKTPPPKPSVRIPVSDVVIVLAQPLKAGTAYRLRAADLRSLLGYTRSSERVFTTPKPRPIADSTAKDTTARDTTARDTTARDTTARDTKARDTAARDTAARDTAARDTTARAIAARVSTARGGVAIPAANRFAGTPLDAGTRLPLRIASPSSGVALATRPDPVRGNAVGRNYREER
ncbi:MAG: Ig-like domain-containing protein [Gemmatimonadaceae bacterium]